MTTQTNMFDIIYDTFKFKSNRVRLFEAFA